jgi:hypothetical protein
MSTEAPREPRDVRQRVEIDPEGVVTRVEREVLPPRLRDLPAAPRVLHPPVQGEPVASAQREMPLPTLRWERVGPTVAEEWLTHNSGNRALKDSRVEYYARLMREGLWRNDNPEPLAFDWNDVLRNGQHRLTAVVRSKRTVVFLVARGMDPALGDVIDTPAIRTAGDRLALAGGVTAALGARYAAAIRGLVAWEEFPERGPFERQPQARSNAEMVALLPNYIDLLTMYVPLATRITQAGVRGGTSLWLTLLCRFHQIDPAAAEAFGDALATGADLSRGNPILALRNTLIKSAVDPASRPGSGLGRLVTARYAVQAWNGWREGRSLSELHRPGPGEAFPKIEGQQGYSSEAADRRGEFRRRGRELVTFPGSRGAENRPVLGPQIGPEPGDAGA